MKPQFNIGDVIWVARCGNVTKQIECPDCMGTGQMTVKFADGQTVSVECGLCKHGYEPSTGTVPNYIWEAKAEAVVVSNIEVNDSSVRYNWVDVENCFGTEEEAVKRASELEAEHNAAEMRRLTQQKERQDKPWAWNASYHRKRLKQAEQDVIYHTQKLNVAKIKAKE